MRRAPSSLSILTKSLRLSQNIPRILTPIPPPSTPFPKYPQSRPLQTLSHSTPPSPPSSRQQKLINLSDLEDAFESATATNEILSTFKALESALPPTDKRLALACLRVGQHLYSTEPDAQDRALEFARRSLKTLDAAAEGKDSVELAAALHLAGAVSYNLRRFNDSLGFLNRFNRILSTLEKDGGTDLDVRPVAHAVNLALANTKTAMGRREEALANLRRCLEIKEAVFEPNSNEVAESCRDLAEAHAAILNFKDALPLCLKALQIHKSQLGTNSVEVAQDRRLLGVIYTGLDRHEEAMEENEKSQKVLKQWGMGSDVLHAEIDAANIQIASGKYEEAIGTLKRAVEETDHDSQMRAMVLVSLGKALCNQEKNAEGKRCLEMARLILEEEEEAPAVAEAYTEMAMMYESMNEFETAISLLKRSLEMYEKMPEEQHMEGNVLGKIGMLMSLTGKVEKAVGYLERAAERMKESLGPKYFGVGHVYNNLGAAYMEMERPQTAAQMFAMAKDVLDVALGPEHSDSIQTMQNLANAYGTMGR